MFDAGTRDADRVALLERILADCRGRNLAADNDERDGIHVGGGNTGHRIGNAGAGGHEAHSDITRRARVGVGGMNRGLFVAHENVLDLVLLVQLVVDIEYRAAGIAPNELDFFISERMSTVPPMDSASREEAVSDVENSALGIFIHLSNFRQKIDWVLSAGLMARVQGARLEVGFLGSPQRDGSLYDAI